MSLTIKLKGKDGSLRPDHEVYVRLKGGGGTNGKINSEGTYDTKLDGVHTVEKVTCYGEVLHDYNLPVNSNTTLNLTYK